MSIRWRKNGELYCAAKTAPEEGDTYINDLLQYELAVIQKVLVPDKNESETGRWHWLHGECSISEHPDDARAGIFVRSE